MDSFVFLDDNPFERNAVRSLIPEITVPELPENPEEYVDYLRGLNLFETASYSEEDRVRTQQYQAEARRVSLQSQCADYDA
jgi:predicted enzyme involved in methoxymalonyl-ACP biosynthesis